MRPTRRGVALLLAAVALLAFGWWGPYPLPAALGAAAFGAVLAAPFLASGDLPGQVSRVIVPDRVERGRPALAQLRTRNVHGRPQGAFHATDSLGGHTRTITVDGLAAGAESVHRYELPTETRGRLPVGPLVLHRTDPFGLVRRRLGTGDTAVVWVYPRQLPARSLTGGRPPHHGGSVVDTLRGSADLQDVREYVPGDEVRHLHWKATARTGRLMVRDLADPQPGRFTVLLDTRDRILTPDVFTEAVDVAASLIGAAVRAGQRAHLGTPGGLSLAVRGGPPDLRRVLEALCELRQTDSSYGPLTSGPLVPGGALVVVTGDRVDVPAGVRRRFTRTVVIAMAGTPTGPEAGGTGTGGTGGGGTGGGGTGAGGTGAAGTAGVLLLRAGDAPGAVRLWNEAVR